jgi:hypothetical protein
VLRLPLQWLSTKGTKGRQAGSSTGASTSNAGGVRIRTELPADDVSFSEFSPFFTDLVLPCPAGQTSIAGACADAHIDPKDLFPSNGGSHLGQVYGGALGAEGATVVGGSCFGVDECFADAPALRAEDLDPTTCTVRKSSNPAGDVSLLNFGLKRKAADCSNQKCVVPLDYETPTVIKNGGWRESNGAAVLPPAVCERLKDGSLEAVLVSTTCDHKSASIPTCGPWSSMKTEVAKQRSANGYYVGSTIADAGPDSPTDASDGGLTPFATIPPDLVLTPVRMAYDSTKNLLWVKGGRKGTVSIDLARSSVITRLSGDTSIAGAAFAGFVEARGGNLVIADSTSRYVEFAGDAASSANEPGYRVRGVSFAADDFVALAETDGTKTRIRFAHADGTQKLVTVQLADGGASGDVGGIFTRAVSQSERYLYITTGGGLVKADISTWANIPSGTGTFPNLITVMTNPPSAYNAQRVGSVYSQDQYAFHFQAETTGKSFALLRTEYLSGSTQVFSGKLDLANLKTPEDTTVPEVLFRANVIGDGSSVYFSDGYAIYRRAVGDGALVDAPAPLVPRTGNTHVYAMALSNTELFWADENGAVYRMPKPTN